MLLYLCKSHLNFHIAVTHCANLFQCGSVCLDRKWVCDGYASCRDGSDERHCESGNLGISNKMFYCIVLLFYLFSNTEESGETYQQAITRGKISPISLAYQLVKYAIPACYRFSEVVLGHFVQAGPIRTVRVFLI